MKQSLVNCPQCGTIVVWTAANRYRPFCSERCKMIDLGEWAAESYRIPDTEKETERQEDDVSKRREAARGSGESGD